MFAVAVLTSAHRLCTFTFYQRRASNRDHAATACLRTPSYLPFCFHPYFFEAPARKLAHSLTVFPVTLTRLFRHLFFLLHPLCRTSIPARMLFSRALRIASLAVVFLLAGAAHALYTSGDDVVQLTAANFDSLVANSPDPWIVEFFAPWCGHCVSLAPEYKKAASVLKGIVKVGAVDATQAEALASRFQVRHPNTPEINDMSHDIHVWRITWRLLY